MQNFDQKVNQQQNTVCLEQQTYASPENITPKLLVMLETFRRSDPYHLNNKDPQRMMVNPMFMIVQSLRSFLTAVTPTAVAPMAIILPVFT